MSAPLTLSSLILNDFLRRLKLYSYIDAVQQLSTGDHSEERIRIRIRTST